MAILRKSLAEDSVDRYGHTWAFLFLLLLSLITLFIPLSPSMTLKGSSSSLSPDQRGVVMTAKGTANPTFKPACWLPVSFTLSMATYTHMVCSSAYNAMVQGRNSSTASLYHRDEHHVVPMQGGGVGGESFKLFASKQAGKAREARVKMARRTQDLVSYKTPLYLFILALLLRLPHAVWSFLTICFQCINMDRTLAAAQTAQSLNSDSQRRVYQEIALILVGMKKKTTGLLYLLMKLLMIVVACVGIYYTSNDLLAETEDLQENQPGNGHGKSNGEFSGMSYLTWRSKNESEVHDLQDFPEFLFCGFDITQLQNVQSFLVQCIFMRASDDTTSNDGEGSANLYQAMRDDGSGMSEDQILLMYKALFSSVLVVFVLLVIFNGVSLLAWCMTLLLPGNRAEMGLDAQATVDYVFLIAMARQNTSCFVVRELAKRSAESGGDGK